MKDERSSDPKTSPTLEHNSSETQASASSLDSAELDQGLSVLQKKHEEQAVTKQREDQLPQRCTTCSALLRKDASFCDSCGTKVTPPEDPLLGRIFGEKYKVLRKLGQGGFGAVYEAEESRLKRKVAIKTLHRHLSENRQLVKRFLQEGVTASRLEHPNIVKIYDLGDTKDGYLWIAMEFLTGQPLDEYLKTQDKIAPSQLLSLMGPVCEALAEAHQKGIVHRDVKPQNVMLVKLSERQVPKVLDFGISKLADAEYQTASGTAMGTPQYMPPEQWESAKEVTPASDVYSLGIMLYQMLSKRFPFQANSTQGWMKKHCQETPAPLLPFLPSSPQAKSLAAVVMKTLAKAPSERYPDALALKKALEQALAPGGPTALRIQSAQAILAVSSRKVATPGPAVCSRCDQDHEKGSPACPAFRVGQTIASKYRVLRLMGSGGMGAVYEAEHLTLHKRVAVKMLHLNTLHSNLKTHQLINRRFEEEARRAASLKHPGIIEVTDLGNDHDGSAYIEMAVLEGRPVADLIQESPLPIAQALSIATQTLEALAFAHKKGIIHRDLKPDNIFYAKESSGAFHAKILDFGIAKLVEESDQQLTQTGSMMGTPYYMSPEQASDSKRVDARSDIYSMGATLFEMLTGRRSVSGQTLNQLLTQLIEDRVERNPKKFRPEVPDWLDKIVAQMMAKEPEERPQSADDVLTMFRKPPIDETTSTSQSISKDKAPFSGTNKEVALIRKPTKSRFLLIGGSVVALGIMALFLVIFVLPEQKKPDPSAALILDTPASQEMAASVAVTCVPLESTGWKEGEGKATGEGIEVCDRAIFAAKEDAIRSALCLAKNDSVTASFPQGPEDCRKELRETLRTLAWKAQVIGAENIKTEQSAGICKAQGRFQVMPLPSSPACRFSITMSEKHKTKKNTSEDFATFRLIDSHVDKGALYLFSVFSDGRIFPFWGESGAQKIYGKLVHKQTGKTTRFEQPKYALLDSGDYDTLVDATLSIAQEHSGCEVLLAARIPVEQPFHVTTYRKKKGNVVDRIGTFFKEIDRSIGGLEHSCIAFQPYQIVR